MLGGWNGENKVIFTQIYDPETDSWSEGTPMPHPVTGERAGATTGAMPPKRIYVFGGYDRYNTIDLTQVYDPKNDSWTMGKPMLLARTSFKVAVVDDVLYAIGGTTAAGGIAIYSFGDNQKYTPIGYGTPDPSYKSPTPRPSQTPESSSGHSISTPEPLSSRTPTPTASPSPSASQLLTPSATPEQAPFGVEAVHLLLAGVIAMVLIGVSAVVYLWKRR